MGLMHIRRNIYRLTGLDGRPHQVLDAPYESIDAAKSAAQNWCNGQGSNCPISQKGIGIEVLTISGEWRTIGYPQTCLDLVPNRLKL